MRDPLPPTDDDMAAFGRTIAGLRALPADDPIRLRAERVADSLVRDGRRERRRARRASAAAADRAVAAAAATGAPGRDEDTALETATGTAGTYTRPQRCYVCKGHYRRADAFYHRLCPGCAADNTARRTARADLTGRRALLTGGRVKIGFELARMLLRDGAELVVTTRFPQDALRRFRSAPGSDAWADRLTVVGVDLRDPRQVVGLCDELVRRRRPFDILVNNAAQTIRRPDGAYAALRAGETGAPGPGVLLAPGFAPAPGDPPVPLPAEVVPAGTVPAGAALAGADTTGLLPDPSPANSWTARLGEIPPAELLETQLVNAVAPALLCDRLLPLLLASPHPRRYIVNVSAVEGRFDVRGKTARHPHTNMAKAALNMLTRTSGPELAAQGVYMCAVDTGWITNEHPAPARERQAARGFRTPLDVVDGAARVYDPIVRGEAGDPVAGVFLKDYRVATW
jgi:NAD(P)-dependent dehydrogenase (short-subunit alcohol dehydrogenase family)